MLLITKEPQLNPRGKVEGLNSYVKTGMVPVVGRLPVEEGQLQVLPLVVTMVLMSIPVHLLQLLEQFNWDYQISLMVH